MWGRDRVCVGKSGLGVKCCEGGSRLRQARRCKCITGVRSYISGFNRHKKHRRRCRWAAGRLLGWLSHSRGTTVYGSMCNERGGTLEDSHGEDEKKSLWRTEDPRCPTRPIARAQTPLPHDASESLEASLEAQVTKTDATVGHHWRTRAVLAPRLRRVGWLDGQTKTMDRKGKPECAISNALHPSRVSSGGPT